MTMDDYWALRTILEDASDQFASCPTDPELEWRKADAAKLERAWDAIDALERDLRGRESATA